MRRSLDTVLVLRISPSSQRERPEGRAGSEEAMEKSGPESEGRGCQVAARAMEGREEEWV